MVLGMVEQDRQSVWPREWVSLCLTLEFLIGNHWPKVFMTTFKPSNERINQVINITPLPEGFYFVFGSNTAGIHGKGAALDARVRFGAQLGVGEGLTGFAYALPTCNRKFWCLAPDEIKASVDRFIAFAEANPLKNFCVSQVGCGLAGLQKGQVAPLFEKAGSNCWFDTAWEPWLGPNRKYWGHM